MRSLMIGQFSKTTTINSEPSAVWRALTDPAVMSSWMGEPETKVQVFTTWQINSPILVTGTHHGKFENKGIVLDYEENKKLIYTHLSSVSHLADVPESYSIFEFVLMPDVKNTLLTINVKNFPTDVIRKHLVLYWGVTILEIKKIVEKSLIQNA